MSNILKKKTIWLTAAAVVMAGSVSIGSAMAYFTTNTSASGGYQISLGSKTTITETFSDWTKHITIQNTGDNECFVRVKAFCGSQFSVDYTSVNTGEWSKGEGDYWYYREAVPAGESTSQLDAKIRVPEEFKDDFDVVVIQECTPVLYDENGVAYADWNQVIDTTTGIGEGEGADQ